MKGRMFGILVIGVLVVGMVGCGKQDVDYATDSEENTVTSEDKTENDKGVPMHVNENIVLNNGSSVVIDADVEKGAHLGNMPVANVEIDRWDLEELEAFAEKVFDEGSWEPIIHNTQEIDEGDLALQWTVYHDEEDGSESFSICYAKGQIGDKDYGLNVRVMDGNYTICLGQVEAEYQPVFFESYGLGDTRAVLPSASAKYLKNECDLSKEEAVEWAEDFIEDFGLDTFSTIGVFDAFRIKESDDTVQEITDGYVVYLGREIDGFFAPCIANYLGDSCYDSTAEEWINYYGYECITILVDDNGVVAFRYDNPMQEKELITNAAGVMSFEKVHQIAVEYMKDLAQNSGRDSVVTNLELSLVRMTYEDDTYAMVPAWVYSWKTGNDFLDEEQIVLVVNAIDGAIIDVQSGKILE